MPHTKPYDVCPNCGAHLDHGERCDCQQENETGTKKLCIDLLERFSDSQLQRAYLLLNRIYTGGVIAVTSDYADYFPNEEEARLTARLIGKMSREKAKRVYSFAGKLYCGG